MDWFDDDDNIFMVNEKEYLSKENIFDLENVFMKKQHFFVDYELKIDEFVLDGSNTCKIDSKNGFQHIGNVGFLDKEKLNEKIFEISKEKPREVQNIKSVSKKKRFPLTKEEFSKHPFLVNNNLSSTKTDVNYHSTASVDEISGFATPKNETFDSNIRNDELQSENYLNDNLENVNEELSVNTNSDSLINNHSCIYINDNQRFLNNFNSKDAINRNLFNESNGNFMDKVCGSTDPNQILYNMSTCNGSLRCPFNYYVNLNNLPLSERMRIKKERVKLLLERKTKRDDKFFYENKNNSDKITMELSPHSQISNSTKTQSNQTNRKNEDNKAEINLNQSHSQHNESILNNNVSKKEMKILRNRVSAQRSRDRKKKEYDDLKIISQNLLNENSLYKRELESRDRQLAEIKEKFNLICKNCHIVMNSKCSDKINNNHLVNNQRYSIVDASRRNFPSTLKYSLMAGLLVIVCLVGVFAISREKDTSNEIKGRVLSSVENRKEDNPLTNKNTKNIFEKNSAGVILYDSNNKIYPFTIKKDIEKLIQRKNSNINNSQKNSINSYSSTASSISNMDNIDPTENIKLNSFLTKKRMDFTNKLDSKKEFTRGFLQKKNLDTCVNTDGMSHAINYEIDLNDEIISEYDSLDDYDNKINFENDLDNKNFNNGIVVKSNINNNNNNSANQVVPFKDLRYSYENSVLRDNIKSMYCRDFITTAEENSQMFKNMFNKINLNIENMGKGKSDDCLYLHMIVPSNDRNVPSQENSNSDKFTPNEHIYNSPDNDSLNKDRKIYYEVGCKVFEINKIYK